VTGSFQYFFQDVLENPLTMVCVILGLVPIILGLIFLVFNPKLFLLIFKNLGRNKVRTSITMFAIALLVAMITMIGSVIYFLDRITREKAADLKIIVTERWQLPSQMNPQYGDYLDPTNPKFLPALRDLGIKEGDFMTWTFYGGSIDPKKRSPENSIFFFSMNPDHILPMLEDIQNLDPALVEKLKETRNGCLIGRERLAKLNKKVGERITVTSFNYKGINLEFEIVGQLPEGRYNQNAIMNKAYFDAEMDTYTLKAKKQHPMAEKRLNLIWLRVKDKETFQKAGAIIEKAPELQNPQVKVETASSAIGAFLEAYRTIIDAMKYLLIPALLISMALVVSNAIGISVRERTKEMAVMKVLGYRPGQILILILGESLLVGGLAGVLSAGLTFITVNYISGGINFPIAFFPVFYVPMTAWFWGLAIGFVTAFLGSFIPSWSARSVRVSEVFAKTT
jgi:putative ABC transport system permease protein